MNFNFELILFYATLVTGLISLLDMICFAPRRRQRLRKHLPVLIDWSRSFFPVLLIVFLFRSFLFEPFRIPSGSLEPTLLTGDFILVNKYDYGVRLPVIHKKLYGKQTPKRGDIVIFRWPPDPSYDFIKRVIGLPGDHISYVNKQLTINGVPITQSAGVPAKAFDEMGQLKNVEEKQENLMGVKHDIYVDPLKSSEDFRDIIVPNGMYFMMGDNRDDSADSRYWGFVPDHHIVGKAVMVWMSWDSQRHRVRMSRLGHSVD